MSPAVGRQWLAAGRDVRISFSLPPSNAKDFFDLNARIFTERVRGQAPARRHGLGLRLPQGLGQRNRGPTSESSWTGGHGRICDPPPPDAFAAPWNAATWGRESSNG